MDGTLTSLGISLRFMPRLWLWLPNLNATPHAMWERTQMKELVNSRAPHCEISILTLYELYEIYYTQMLNQ